MAPTPPTGLRNIGPVSASWLADVGVYSRADLERLGAVSVYAMVLHRQPTTSLNLLWALEGALRDIDCRDLPAAEKSKLKQQLDTLLA